MRPQYLAGVALVVGRAEAELHVAGVPPGGRGVCALQHCSAQRHAHGGLGVQGPDLQRLQPHQHHHQLFPRHHITGLCVPEASLRERGNVYSACGEHTNPWSAHYSTTGPERRTQVDTKLNFYKYTREH